MDPPLKVVGREQSAAVLGLKPLLALLFNREAVAGK